MCCLFIFFIIVVITILWSVSSVTIEIALLSVIFLLFCSHANIKFIWLLQFLSQYLYHV